MKKILLLCLLCPLIYLCSGKSHGYIPENNIVDDSIPSFLIGDHLDDYGIGYTINDRVWIQHPHAKYHILKWNIKEQYIIARNDTSNPTNKGLYSRIDYMKFNDMDPWKWGFCLTVYNAASDPLAEFSSVKADRNAPKKGCNGYPFSRMRSAL